MKTIWKFEVPMMTNPNIAMPIGAKILAVQTQNGKPHIWAMVDSLADYERRRFVIVGTGSFFSGVVDKYVGTFQLNEDSINFVFYLFEEVYNG